MNLQRTEEDRHRMRTTVGPTIWINVEITNIKKNPKCDTQAPLEEKLVFFEKVREMSRELIGLF